MPDWELETRSHAPLARELGVRSSAAVVIGHRDAPVGVLSGHSTSPGRVGDDDAAFMVAVANVLASAADAAGVGGRGRRAVGGARAARRARARRRGPRAPRASPRRCTTARCRTCSRSATTSPGCAPPPRATRTTSAASRDGLARAVTQIREVMLDLHPVQLQVGGLESALRAICTQQAAAAGYTCVVEIEPAAAGRRDELVLSLARELLRNVAKHAGARRGRGARGARGRRACGSRSPTTAAGVAPDRLGEALGAGPHRARLQPRARGGDRRLVPRRRRATTAAPARRPWRSSPSLAGERAGDLAPPRALAACSRRATAGGGRPAAARPPGRSPAAGP